MFIEEEASIEYSTRWLMPADCVCEDEDGDTVLHEALYKNHNDVVDILLACPRLDFSVINKRSFTVLHMAAYKGNVESVSHTNVVIVTAVNDVPYRPPWSSYIV